MTTTQKTTRRVFTIRTPAAAQAVPTTLAAPATPVTPIAPNQLPRVSKPGLIRARLEANGGAIRSGLIDIVVVYKVDRLTRSLLDFSKLVETFDQAGVSFVSTPWTAR